MLKTLINICIRNQNYRLDHFGTGRNQFLSSFGVILISETIIFVTYGPEVPGLFVRWAHIVFRTHVFPNQLAWVLPPKTQSKALKSCCKITLTFSGFPLSTGILMDQRGQKLILVLRCQVIHSHTFSSLITWFFQQAVNRYPFTWNGIIVFSYREEFSRRNWSPDWQKVAGMLFACGYFVFPTRRSWELQVWIVVSRSQLTVTYFKCFKKQTLSVRSIGILMVPNFQQVQSTFKFRRTQTLFRQSLYPDFLVFNGFFWGVNWCAFGQNYLPPLTEDIALRLRFLLIFWNRSEFYHGCMQNSTWSF